MTNYKYSHKVAMTQDILGVPLPEFFSGFCSKHVLLKNFCDSDKICIFKNGLFVFWSLFFPFKMVKSHSELSLNEELDDQGGSQSSLISVLWTELLSSAIRTCPRKELPKGNCRNSLIKGRPKRINAQPSQEKIFRRRKKLHS